MKKRREEDTPGCSATGVVCSCSVEVGDVVCALEIKVEVGNVVSEVVGDTSETVVEVSGAEEVELSFEVLPSAVVLELVASLGPEVEAGPSGAVELELVASGGVDVDLS